MALHTFTFTPLQTRMMGRILHDEISAHENLLQMLKDQLEIPVDQAEMEEELIVLKKIYAQFTKKLL